MLYFVVKFLHVIGAAVLLGTGIGIAFFMLAAHIGGKAEVIAGVARSWSAILCAGGRFGSAATTARRRA
jgi:uncharacterized membrane protein